MKSRYIQLPNGVVMDKIKEKTIQLNLLPNYKNNPFRQITLLCTELMS